MREPLTFDEVYSFIEDTYPNRYRCIDSSKFDYKAVHLYFKENNQSFPWELQIWNMPGYAEFRDNQAYPEEKNIPKFQRESLKYKGLSAKTSG